MTSGKPMLAEMGGVTFTPGVYTHASAINIAASAKPVVYLDADGDSSAVFIFNVGTTLTTSAGSEIVLLNGARKENVFWVLGTTLTMGADSILVGNVLAGSAITIGTNGSIMGRAIAHIAVTCATHCTIEPPSKVVITVKHDRFPWETGWTLTDDSSGTVVASQASGSFTVRYGTLVDTVYLTGGSYTFEMTDTWGDGICCGYGYGEFTITVNGIAVFTGGHDFTGRSYTAKFNIGGAN
jgi:hypothetical protein